MSIIGILQGTAIKNSVVGPVRVAGKRLVSISIYVILAFGPACSLHAQTPRTAPRSGFVFYEEHRIGIFESQRWVNSAEPEVSPSGICDCITIVYLGSRRVLTIDPGTVMSSEIDPRSGRDINGDKVPEIIVSQYTGGAHCCSSTTVYSVSEEPKMILHVDSGNCAGDFDDLDHDGKLEFVVCDDAWAYERCPFANSPMPRVVYAYSPTVGRYVPATPRYWERFQQSITRSVAQAEKDLADPNRDKDLDICTVLGPVLDLMYAGKLDEGVALLRRLYRQANGSALEQETVEKVRRSSHWTASAP